MKHAFDAKHLPWVKGVRLAGLDENGLIALDKSAGVLSHPNKKGDLGRALLRAPYDAVIQAYRVLGDDGSELLVYLLNRLDSATSGLLLMTTSKSVRNLIREAFEKKKVRKTYEALVFGVVRPGPVIWKDRLTSMKSEGTARALAGGGVSAETRLLRSQQIPGIPAMSRITLMPITGRTHQLRIQTAKRGTPIVGDRTYGDFSKNKQIARSKEIKRLCLHCAETAVEYRLNGRVFRFAAKSKCPF